MRFLLLLGLLLVGCSSTPSLTTDTRSDSLPDPAARREFLKRYYKLPSPVEQVSFHIWYQDNSGGGVPGPSDRDLRIVAKVKPEDLDAWVNNFSSAEELDVAWVNALVDWELGDSPEFYGDDREMVLLYRQTGIVARRSRTL